MQPMSSPTPASASWAALPHARALAGRGHGGAARAHREARSDAARVRHGHRRPRAGRREGGRGRARPRRRAAAARHPRRLQGHLLHARHPDHGRLGAARRLGARRGRDVRHALQEAGAVMLGKLITHEFAFGIQSPGPSLPARAQPVEPRPHPRRLQQRLRRGARGRAVRRRARLRHGRLDPRAGRVLRHRRAQADLRPLQPRRRASRCRGRSTTPGRWRARSRTARTCCRRWPATTRSTRPRAARRSPDYVAPLGRRSADSGSACPRDFFFEGVDPEVARAFEDAMDDAAAASAPRSAT